VHRRDLARRPWPLSGESTSSRLGRDFVAAREAFRQGGLRTLVRSARREARYRRGQLGLKLRGRWHQLKRVSRAFEFGGERYRYFSHWYNTTWQNERTVEVPIGLRALDAAPAGPVLEIGNVLSHYRRIHHAVVDKYEQAPGVQNIDVMDLAQRPDRYALIVSLSTLEHVGWDEEPRDPGKAPRALDLVGQLLAPGGRALVTVPLGHNPGIDEAVFRPREGAQVRFLKRMTLDNQWSEVSPDAARGTKYGEPFPYANCIAVIRWSLQA
jgi:hypothetical protein